MQINIAICDDERESIEKIRNKILDIVNGKNIQIDIFTYLNSKSAVDVLQSDKEHFDILLLDIDMPELSGLEVAKAIRKKRENIILIFVSAHEQYVFESIEYSPFRYIRKSKLTEELPLAMKAAFARLENDKEKSIIIKTDDGEVRLFYSEIMYYETGNRRINMYLSNGKVITTWKTVKELIEEMNDERFIKLHSGCVVNVKYISEYSKSDVTLDNGEKLIVSRRNIKDVKEELLKYWRGRI
ncbi:MAG: response regulator transcription factor [Lachnospiraceae bacterium]|nr:response regulator transcription factor [Lachnospiraceae bacterium]